MIKSDSRHTVEIVKESDDRITVRHRWAMDLSSILRRILGLAPWQRRVRGAVRLSRARVMVILPIRLGRSKAENGTRVMELRQPFVPGVNALEALVDGAATVEHARRIGDIVGRIVRARLFHRDLKLRNLVLTSSDHGPSVVIIDADGVRRSWRPHHAMVRMLDRLVVEPITEGVDVPRSLWQTVLRAALRDRDRSARRATLALLRAHLKREYG